MNFSISTNNPTTLAATAMGSVHCSPFAGKEKDAESGYHYFGARYYDSEALTGWLSVDPMADKYPSISPYASCAKESYIILRYEKELIAAYWFIGV